MKRFAPLLLFTGSLVVLAFVLFAVFNRRVARDLYPMYSSLRADPMGTRAFHDALAAVPGQQVDRWVRPVDKLPALPPRTIIFAGAWSHGWTSLSSETFNAIDGAARDGSRVVILFRGEKNQSIKEAEELEELQRKWRESGEESERRKDGRNPQRKRSDPVTERDPDAAKRIVDPATKQIELGREWGFSLGHDLKNDETETPALRATDAPAALPAMLRWGSDRHLEFNPGMGWRTLYRRGKHTVLAEMPLGRGTVVLATETYFLSNEAMQRDRATPLLSWLVGGNPRVLFVESHLGVEENPGVAALARRYGLAPAAALGMLLAGLFFWRRAALFVPPDAESGHVTLDYQPTAGLAALLRRALPVAQVVTTGLAEWRKTARTAELARAARAVDASTGAHPVTAYNQIVSALRAGKGGKSSMKERTSRT